jgi:hypothetical protein
MIKLSPNLQSEIISTKLGAARLGAEIFRSKATNANDFGAELQ